MEDAQLAAALRRRHLAFAWWSLLFFLTLGLLLEAFHGLKIGWYLDTGNEVRRLMFTLAHAHGTLLALVHAAFAVTLPAVPSWAAGPRELASKSLLAASVLLPAGFGLGGIVIYDGDPGLPVLLVPLGGLCLLLGVLWTARAVQAESAPPAEKE